MSLQIVTVKEIEKERNTTPVTAGFYPGTSWGNIPPPKKTSEIPQEFQDCLYFYVARKMNRYCIAARLSSKANL